MNKLSILCLIVLLLARFSLEADKIWLGYADKDYYLELSQSGSREKAVEACANLNATLVMLKNNATRAKVLSMIPYLTPLGKPYAFHLGLKRSTNRSSHFRWDDGTKLSNDTAWWADKEPSNSDYEYVIMGKINTFTGEFKWKSVGNVSARFICERNKGFPDVKKGDNVVIEKYLVTKTLIGKKSEGLKFEPPADSIKVAHVTNKFGKPLLVTDDGVIGPDESKEAPYSMLTLIGIVALGAIVIATIVFVISYVMERRNSHFV